MRRRSHRGLTPASRPAPQPVDNAEPDLLLELSTDRSPAAVNSVVGKPVASRAKRQRDLPDEEASPVVAATSAPLPDRSPQPTPTLSRSGSKAPAAQRRPGRDTRSDGKDDEAPRKAPASARLGGSPLPRIIVAIVVRAVWDKPRDAPCNVWDYSMSGTSADGTSYEGVFFFWADDCETTDSSGRKYRNDPIHLLHTEVKGTWLREWNGGGVDGSYDPPDKPSDQPQGRNPLGNQ